MVIPVFAETFKINKFLPIYFLTFFAFFSKFIFLGSAGRAEPFMIQGIKLNRYQIGSLNTIKYMI